LLERKWTCLCVNARRQESRFIGERLKAGGEEKGL